MKELAASIRDYCKYLHSLGLNVSVHFTNESVMSLPKEIYSLIQRYNTHSNPYCVIIKKKLHKKCLHSQKALICSSLDAHPFFRVCHAGVKEYIQPFFMNGSAIGVIAVSGYKGEESIDMPEARESYLTEAPSSTELFDTLLPPLKMMLEKLFERAVPTSLDEYNMIVQYLGDYYASADLDSISRHFHRSRSHISHMFKKNSGMTLRAYCNTLKLEHAKRLLTLSNMSVTQIAFESGFNDVSHFINLFRRKYGESPLVYRKNRLD